MTLGLRPRRPRRGAQRGAVPVLGRRHVLGRHPPPRLPRGAGGQHDGPRRVRHRRLPPHRPRRRLRAARRRRLRAHHRRHRRRSCTTSACSPSARTARAGHRLHPGPLRPRVGLPAVRRGDPRRTPRRSCRSAPGRRRLAMAGGVALNCVANTEILRQTAFEELYIMPNAGDRGLAAGAAPCTATRSCSKVEERHPLTHDYLGPPNPDDEIVGALENADGIEHHRSDDIAAECAPPRRRRRHHRLGAGRRRVRAPRPRPPQPHRRPPHHSTRRSGSTRR